MPKDIYFISHEYNLIFAEKYKVSNMVQGLTIQ